MKAIVGILVMILLMMIAQSTKAQVGAVMSNDYMEVTCQKYKDGAYSFNIVGKNLGGNFTWNFSVSTSMSPVSYSSGWAGGNSAQTGQIYKVITPATTGAITFHVTSVYTGANGQDITFIFGALPVTITGFAVANDQDGNLVFTWNTMMEQNVHHFEVRQVSDVRDPVVVASVKPLTGGNSNSKLQYKAVVVVARIVKAGLGWVVALMLLGGLIFKRKRMVASVACVLVIASVSIVSCSKKDVMQPTLKKQKVTFQLIEYDLDGHMNFASNQVQAEVLINN